MIRLIAMAALAVVSFSQLNANAETKGPRAAGFQYYAAPEFRWLAPPNNMHLFDRRKSTANITEQQFNQIVDDVVRLWQPIAQAKGVNLVAEKLWDDSTVNASAFQSGRNWYISMYGGLARRPEITPDGFALVVCHELGHHFAGYAFSSGWAWASNEGQSDYFATQTCARYLWGRDQQTNAAWRFRENNLSQVAEQKCLAAWPNNTNAQGWCFRAAAASLSTSTLLSVLGSSPAPTFETPDTRVVSRMNSGHPAAQCRLDTYFAGALCTKNLDINIIPGKGNPKGQMSVEAELEAMKHSCGEQEGFTLGTRPKCWFKSAGN